ncbi:hypothetical protein NE865_04216 [Phthorimaea operculella]|nr:hypothetical protein NE865_04216 [Phthorimaea operculella]
MEIVQYNGLHNVSNLMYFLWNTLYSDSQAALKSLNKTSTTLVLVKECKLALYKLPHKTRITDDWVSGHQGNTVNEVADELTRQGSDETFICPEICLLISG